MDSVTQGYLMALIFAAMGLVVMLLTWSRKKK